jgi:hypothetical protein
VGPPAVQLGVRGLGLGVELGWELVGWVAGWVRGLKVRVRDEDRITQTLTCRLTLGPVWSLRC